MIFIITSIIGYFLGCINGAKIIGMINNIDVKSSGTGNAGASNVTMLLGWKSGIIVFLIDIAKVIVPILILKSFTDNYLLIYLLGAFVIIGHNFPIHMKFDGGKGTASVLGMLFAINWKAGLLAFLFLVVVSLLTDYLVIGTLFYYFIFTIISYNEYGFMTGIVAFLLTIVFLFKHKENYKRIKSNEEKTIWSFVKKEKGVEI